MKQKKFRIDDAFHLFFVPPTALWTRPTSQVGLLRTQSRRLPQQGQGAEISLSCWMIESPKIRDFFREVGMQLLTDRGSGQQMGNHHRLHQ